MILMMLGGLGGKVEMIFAVFLALQQRLDHLKDPYMGRRAADA